MNMILKYIKKSPNPSGATMKILNILVICMHTAYGIVFFMMGLHQLVLVDLFSVTIYIFLAMVLFNNDTDIKIVLAIFQFEVTLHAFICIFELGWGNGFEIIFLVFLTITLFADQSYKRLTYLLSVLQVVLFFACYILCKDSILPRAQQDFLIGFHIMIVATFCLSISYMLQISNSIVLTNAKQQNSQMQRLANQDPLTKLQNRNALNDFITKKLRDGAVNFALVLSDIDNFKKINDKYGHNIGDDVLVRISAAFSGVFRKDDFVCRWGGEEFLAIIYDVDTEQALSTLERLRTMIASEKTSYEGGEFSTTLTYGMVYYEKGDDFNVQQMILRADELLYKGKKAGKNRIVTEQDV